MIKLNLVIELPGVLCVVFVWILQGVSLLLEYKRNDNDDQDYQLIDS